MVDVEKVKDIGRQLLIAIGEDPEREGLKKTPQRWAKFWSEFIDYKDNNTHTTFSSSKVDQLVVISNIRTWSLCEHHLLPFYSDISVGYMTTKKMIGASKIPRIVHKNAHKLNVQEGLVKAIADEIAKETGSEHVAVIGKGAHLCMIMRGIKTPSSLITSDLRGCFRHDSQARQEFLQLAEFNSGI